MTKEELWTRYPTLFHMAEAGSWPSIKRHGLLSTESLLDLFAINGRRRTDIMTRRRPTSVVIEHPVHGRAIIRDQKPLSEAKLAACLLDDLTPAQWLKMLNTKVFFWVAPERLRDLRRARAYRQHRQLVLRVDARKLLEVYANQVVLSDRNTGTTSPFAHPRGRNTFLRIHENGRRRIVELAIEGGIADIRRYVIRAEEIGGAGPDAVLFERA
jgi:hypothetical protein